MLFAVSKYSPAVHSMGEGEGCTGVADGDAWEEDSVADANGRGAEEVAAEREAETVGDMDGPSGATDDDSDAEGAGEEETSAETAGEETRIVADTMPLGEELCACDALGRSNVVVDAAGDATLLSVDSTLLVLGEAEGRFTLDGEAVGLVARTLLSVAEDVGAAAVLGPRLGTLEGSGAADEDMTTAILSPVTLLLAVDDALTEAEGLSDGDCASETSADRVGLGAGVATLLEAEGGAADVLSPILLVALARCVDWTSTALMDVVAALRLLAEETPMSVELTAAAVDDVTATVAELEADIVSCTDGLAEPTSIVADGDGEDCTVGVAELELARTERLALAPGVAM